MTYPKEISSFIFLTIKHTHVIAFVWELQQKKKKTFSVYSSTNKFNLILFLSSRSLCFIVLNNVNAKWKWRLGVWNGKISSHYQNVWKKKLLQSISVNGPNGKRRVRQIMKMVNKFLKCMMNDFYDHCRVSSVNDHYQLHSQHRRIMCSAWNSDKKDGVKKKRFLNNYFFTSHVLHETLFFPFFSGLFF